MSAEEKQFYITTAIDYVNDKPHIGHALEKVQADVIARWRRARGEHVWFLTGTDEHGAKIVRAAKKAGKAVHTFVDENSEKFRALKDALNLSWDNFIRTSDEARHWPGAQQLWLKLAEAGDLYKKQYRGLYCVGHEAFVTEKELVDGKCQDHQTAPEVIEEENWFFKLSKYGETIGEKIKNGELRIIPETRKNEIVSLIEQGLADVSFSRPRKDLSWGIPVPNDPEHTMYVWCDALANYITAIGYGQDEARFNRWWPADLHVIGKDILRFHAAIWPGMLLSAGLALPKSIFVHGFVAVDGQKMSKTIGNVIDPVELVKKYGTDPVRYYLMREIPSGEDGDFSTVKFEERYNGDLANGIGNLVARVATLGEKLGDITIGNAGIPEAVSTASRIDELFEEVKLHDILSKLWEEIHALDRWINEDRPWEKDEAAQRECIAKYSAGLLRFARSVAPFLPETAEKIIEQFQVLEGILRIKKGGNLFPRL